MNLLLYLQRFILSHFHLFKGWNKLLFILLFLIFIVAFERKDGCRRIICNCKSRILNSSLTFLIIFIIVLALFIIFLHQKLIICIFWFIFVPFLDYIHYLNKIIIKIWTKIIFKILIQIHLIIPVSYTHLTLPTIYSV